MRFLSWAPWVLLFGAIAAAAVYFRKQLFTIVRGLPEGNLISRTDPETGKPIAGAAAEAVLGKDTAEAGVSWVQRKVMQGAEALPIFGAIVGVDPSAGYVEYQAAATEDFALSMQSKFYAGRMTPDDWRAVRIHAAHFRLNEKIDPVRYAKDTYPGSRSIIFMLEEQAPPERPMIDVYNLGGIAGPTRN